MLQKKVVSYPLCEPLKLENDSFGRKGSLSFSGFADFGSFSKKSPDGLTPKGHPQRRLSMENIMRLEKQFQNQDGSPSESPKKQPVGVAKKAPKESEDDRQKFFKNMVERELVRIFGSLSLDPVKEKGITKKDFPIEFERIQDALGARLTHQECSRILQFSERIKKAETFKGLYKVATLMFWVFSHG